MLIAEMIKTLNMRESRILCSKIFSDNFDFIDCCAIRVRQESIL